MSLDVRELASGLISPLLRRVHRVEVSFVYPIFLLHFIVFYLSVLCILNSKPVT